MTSPPFHILVQTTLPRGSRVPKREKIWEAEHKAACGHGRKRWIATGQWKCLDCNCMLEEPAKLLSPIRAPQPVKIKEPPKETDDKGNLPKDAYRFWIGNTAECSIMRVCRACRRMVYSCEDAQHHIDKYKCTLWLVDAYNYLLRFKKCVVCYKDCYGHQWGVPLCSLACIESWKFGRHPFPAMQVALAMTSDRSLKVREMSEKSST